MPEFRVRAAAADLSFAAAHFITFEGGECERLHGHTYRVAADVGGPLNENQYVLDFVALRDALKVILAELDHRVLLPTQNKSIRVCPQAGEVEVICGVRRWVFPDGDFLLLPIANTTTEALAQYIGERLRNAVKSIAHLRIEISEGTGCAAICEF